MLYVPILDYHDYMFILNYSNPFPVLPNAEVPNLAIWTETIDERYSSSLLGLRYTFFAFSIIVGLVFAWKIKALNYSNWVIE